MKSQTEVLKYCSRCLQDLSRSLFSTNRKRYDGLSSYCRKCTSIYERNRRKAKRKTPERELLFVEGLKRCCTCKEIKKHSEFYNRSNTWDKKQGRCKPCQNKGTRASELKLTEEERKRRRRSIHLKKTYGISLAEYNAMLVEQKGKCAICQSTESKTKYQMFSVDHNHTTGEVRGLLCNPCNTMLGNAYENIATLRRAADYLKENNGIS